MLPLIVLPLKTPARKGKRPFQRKTLDKISFPFSRGKKCTSQGVENRGSLISVPLALRECHYQERKKQQKHEVFGGMFLRHQGHIPDKDFMQVALVCCCRHGVAGMSRELGRDVPDLEKRYARKLWAVFFRSLHYEGMLNVSPGNPQRGCFRAPVDLGFL